jgi:hypothetical protein
MVGIGIVVNGLLFTLPRKKLPGETADALAQQVLDAGPNRASLGASLTNELEPATSPPLASITEHTTHHLKTSK